jgi:hypothetical protein
MSKTKTYIREVNEITNDGEIIVQKRLETSNFESEPPYVKLYLQDIGRLNGLNTSEQKLLNELVFNMGYNNVVPGYKPIKEIIATRLGMPYNTLDKSIKELNVE